MTEHARDIAAAVDALRAGQLVGLPTETVYGLAADARNPDAVAKIFAAKGRPANHPLIVHLASAEQLDDWAREIPEAARILAAAFWPGPLTLILKRQRGVPDAVTGGQDTVGLRVPAHPVAHAVLSAFGGGLAAPSANRFGRISPTTAAHVREELGSSVAMVLDGGECEVGIESTIVDLSRGVPVVLRPGRVSVDEMSRALGAPVFAADALDSSAPRASGTLASHYAPTTPVRLLDVPALLAETVAAAQAGRRIGVLSRTLIDDAPAHGSVWLQLPNDPVGYAHGLYRDLRRLDQCGAEVLLVEAPPRSIEWQAVNDRLRRAAADATAAGEGLPKA
ncbi:L-threonylcarbamoyladenylate synthase [Denitromonas iodatirespirans]|uniref:Threonylcarbamoyl-AMP synthase n=1 Tax=Denitromonas iodatirespirans TaxID=2795389 RepID=A0A944DB08_DENI1|nr:L-threonylcarbamoyladenylate synthase [Denitromonas iodatirespirans]MBT0961142.1 threonylcarbamoyl-AMP synthase [Denitromonas iodatirespirans]